MRIGAANEYDRLRCVVMRYAGPSALDLSPQLVDPVLRRQMTTSSWAPYDEVAVHAQQERFVDLLRSRGVEVVLAGPADGCYAQHYTRDLGFVIDDVFFPARLNSAKRQAEFAAIRPIVEGIDRVGYLDAGTIEGGDVLLHDACVLVGLGEETSIEGVAALQYRLERLGIEREVLPISFSVPGIVHLDDHFNIVAPGVALVHPAVFSAGQMRWFKKRFDLIEVTDDEAVRVQVNTVALAPGVAAVLAGSDRIVVQLRSRRIEVVAVDYSEVTRLPGGLRCSTLPLLRESA